MRIKTILISLLILIFSLPFLVSFLYSMASLCESIGCEMCGIINHHINTWINFFTNVLISENQLFSRFLLIFIASLIVLIVVCLRDYFRQQFINFKLYRKYKLFNSFNSLLFNPIKRLYADAIIDPQIYS